MSLFVTGDTHGEFSRFSTKNFPVQKELTKDDYVVILGDFGGVWAPFTEIPSECYWLDWLNNKNFTTLFVPGNHENYNRLTGYQKGTLDNWLFKGKNIAKDGYPQIKWHGGTVREVRLTLLMLEPGVFDLDGRKCFAFGGAASHDIEDGILNPGDYQDEEAFKKAYALKTKYRQRFRVKDVSWWPQEGFSKEQAWQATGALCDNGRMVDYIFTHDCSCSNKALLGYKEFDELEQFLERIKCNIFYDHWYFGHYHVDKDLLGGREHAMYYKIAEI